MPAIIDAQGTRYQPVSFALEDAFEKCVVDLADEIFGESTIYVDIKKRVAGNNIISVPDGYVVDLTFPESPRLFVVENEIVGHDPFKHIGIQMLRFATSFDGAQKLIRNFIMEEIVKSPESMARLERACSRSVCRNVDAYLDEAVYGEFRGLVIIDEARSELHHVIEKINADISVLELRCFESADGERIFEFDTLYDEDDPAPTRKEKKSDEDRARRRAHRALCDTIIVPAREDGFRRVFLGENRWHETRIGAAMKDKIRYIAAYQTTPVSAVTHIAEVQEIRPWQDTGKYVLVFKNAAEEIGPIPIEDPAAAPQGPVYVKREDLLSSETLDEALKRDG